MISIPTWPDVDLGKEIIEATTLHKTISFVFFLQTWPPSHLNSRSMPDRRSHLFIRNQYYVRHFKLWKNKTNRIKKMFIILLRTHTKKCEKMYRKALWFESLIS